MSSWTPNFDWITDQLAVGGRFDSQQTERLTREHGIRAVVDLRNEDVDDEQLLRRHGITLLHLPTQDMCGVDHAHLERGVAFASEHLDRGERVLVHCEHGIGRSAVLALCILVHRGHAPLDALELLKDRRSRVSPSPEQFACWAGWLEHRQRSRAQDWQVPEFDEFESIAYRHLLIDHHAGHDLIGCQDIAWDVAGAAAELDLDDDEAFRLATDVGALAGAPVSEPLLRFFAGCYPAFQLGHFDDAARSAGDAAEAALLGAARARYAKRLLRVLESPAFTPKR